MEERERKSIWHYTFKISLDFDIDASQTEESIRDLNTSLLRAKKLYNVKRSERVIHRALF